jgi:small-conductance mechanosensitive channel
MGALLKLVENHKLVLQDPKPQVMVNEYRDSTIMINIRVWAESSNFWQLNFDLHQAARKALEQAGMRLPVPVREVKSAQPDALAA